MVPTPSPVHSSFSSRINLQYGKNLKPNANNTKQIWTAITSADRLFAGRLNRVFDKDDKLIREAVRSHAQQLVDAAKRTNTNNNTNTQNPTTEAKGKGKGTVKGKDKDAPITREQLHGQQIHAFMVSRRQRYFWVLAGRK